MENRSFFACVPVTFFQGKMPHTFLFNAELISGNGMIVRAIATGRQGTICRSREYLLFQNGLATLIADDGDAIYVMCFQERRNEKGILYWEVSATEQSSDSTNWTFCVGPSTPDDEDDRPFIELIGLNMEESGGVQQVFYLQGPIR